MKTFKKITLFLTRYMIRSTYFFKDRIEYYTKNIFKKNFLILNPDQSSENKLTLAIFAIYQPKGLGYIIRRSINYLFNQAIRIIVVAPHNLSQKDLEFLNNKQCIVITRKNFGRDFGSYQCGVLYLLDNLYLLNSIDKILFINDSIIFPIKEQDNNLLGLLNLPYEIVGITESFHGNWHICSYFILLKKKIFLNTEMINFWKNYKPYSSRFHAIYHGEIYLGKIIQNISSSYKVIYDGKRLLDVFSSNMLCRSFFEFGDLIYQNINYNQSIRILEKIDLDKNFDLKKLSLLIETHSVLHIFSLALIEYLNCFIIKKDICYRGFFPLSYIIQYVTTVNNDTNFLESLTNILKEKGLPCSMNTFNKILYLSGAL